jgi:hypothetical protein
MVQLETGKKAEKANFQCYCCFSNITTTKGVPIHKMISLDFE